MNTMVLDTPININGKPVSELTYDAQEIGVDLFLGACARAASATANALGQKPYLYTKETDTNTHLYLGMAAVIAVNPEIDFADLERVKGFDIIDLANIGSFFIYRRSAEPSARSDSENSGETTPGTSE